MHSRFLRPLFLCVLLSSSLHAAPRLAGSSHYDFANQETQLILGCDLIDNSSRENATGTLELQLWATAEPYESGTIHGQLLGSAKLEGLSPGQYYKNLRRTVPYTPPNARGTYCLTMLLLEYKNGGYLIESHSNFSNTRNLGPLALFTMDGPARYATSIEGGTADIWVGKISHRRTGSTGELKLALWATTSPYRGGSLQGYEIGAVKKDPLKPGFTYNDVHNVAKLLKPPPGDYYISIVLSEYSGKEYDTVAHIEMNGTAHF